MVLKYRLVLMACYAAGLSADGLRWIAGRSRFFLPVKVLGRLFRGKFLAGLQQLYHRGELLLQGSIAALAQPGGFQSLLRSLYRRDWIVYAKPPLQVIHTTVDTRMPLVPTCPPTPSRGLSDVECD